MENMKIIGERTVSVGTIPPTKAIELQVGLINLAGPALFAAVVQGQGRSKEEIGQAVMSALTGNVEFNSLMKMVRIVFDYTTIDGKRITSIDDAFVGRNMDLWKVFLFGLQYNFADFFAAARSASQSQAQPA